MIVCHGNGLKMLPGAPYHSHHCCASVRLYGWPVLVDAPAAAGRRRVSLDVAERHVAALDRWAARAHRHRGDMLGAVVESYIRTLAAASPSLLPWVPSTRSASWSARPPES